LKNSVDAPKHLSAEARRWWRRLKEEYGIQDAGGLLLLLTAMESFDRMRSAQAAIAEEGASRPDRFAQLRAHPLLSVERDARAAMLAALKALGLDVSPVKNIGRPPGS